ncbi:MAG: elongation factor P [Candidatus Coatesbacteria bacterium]|nr:elongation factor P [Candidatus Coatesbacteria bacterium]
MISSNDIRPGTRIELDGSPYSVVEFQHVKPGKGGAFVRTKLKNLFSGAVLDRTFRAGEKLVEADVFERRMQFLYREQDIFYFMDTETYEQVEVPEEVVGDVGDLMPDNIDVKMMFYKDRPAGVELPNFVNLRVTDTEPGMKGDTVSGATKSAVLSTGATIQVPLFIEEGEVLRVDTRTRSYCERVQETE